jgi:hypothetical protein
MLTEANMTQAQRAETQRRRATVATFVAQCRAMGVAQDEVSEVGAIVSVPQERVRVLAFATTSKRGQVLAVAEDGHLVTGTIERRDDSAEGREERV